MKAPARILVVKLGAFGDLVLADGALQDIRAQYPQAHIALLTRTRFAALMARCPWVDEVITDDNAPRWQLHRMAALRRKIAAGAFQLGFDLQGSRRSAFYRSWLSAGMRWSAPPLRTGPVVGWHATQLHTAGVAIHHTLEPAPHWIAGETETLLQRAGVASPFVVLLPGSSARNADKRWPHYRACAERLHASGCRVVTIPGTEEPDIAADFPGVVLKRGHRVLDLAELAGVLRRAACVIGNDSGPTHLGACLGAPAVVLFPQDSPSLVSTRLPGRRVIALHGQPLASIPLDQVVEAAHSLLTD